MKNREGKMMKIEHIEIFPIASPYLVPMQLGSGVPLKKTIVATILCLTTDEGLSGWGELWHMNSATTWEIKSTVPDIINGQDVLDREHILEKLIIATRHKPQLGRAIQGAVDMALLDIIGKWKKLSLSEMLGGPYRNKIPVTWVMGIKDLATTEAELERVIAEGFSTIKLKVGLDIEDDLKRLQLVRRKLDSRGNIRVDANGAWSPKEAIRNIQRMQEYELQLVEQPVPGTDLNGLRFVRERVTVPIMADESIWDLNDAVKLIRIGAADMFGVRPSEAGGVFNAAKIIWCAEAAGISCMIASNFEYGIGTAVGVHLAASLRNVTIESDIIGPIYKENDILKKNLSILEGKIHLPVGFGLGVDVDKEAISSILVKQ
ncbi:MAG TPA: enolase C-terminal domain-like protein [Erysipelothrix sp.]|nr:enolase C-terminal domain-like protein [Erysipelothrix sp.]